MSVLPSIGSFAISLNKCSMSLLLKKKKSPLIFIISFLCFLLQQNFLKENYQYLLSEFLVAISLEAILIGFLSLASLPKTAPVKDTNNLNIVKSNSHFSRILFLICLAKFDFTDHCLLFQTLPSFWAPGHSFQFLSFITSQSSLLVVFSAS